MRLTLALWAAVFASGLLAGWLVPLTPLAVAGEAWQAAAMVAVGGLLSTAFLVPITRRLRRSARNAEQAIDSTNDGYWVLDSTGRFVEVNEGYCRMVGFSRDEVMGMTIADFEAVATLDRIQAQIQRILKKGYERFETRHRHREGRWVDLEITVTPVDSRYLVAFLRDVSERKAAEARINHLAFYDPLSGLPNRRLLEDRISRALGASERTRQHGALLFVDLDNFKLINDSRGHALGDLVLVQVAQRLSRCVRVSDTVARQGGDEFVVVLEMLSVDLDRATAEVARIAEKCRLELQKPFVLEGGEFHASASIGVAMFVGGAIGPGELEQRADTAMYRAKLGGRNRVVFFEPLMLENLARRTRLEADLREALPLRQLLPYLQPQVDQDGCILGAEILMRWNHPERGWISPLEFIPLAEETGLIVPLGHQVIEFACQQLALWNARPAFGHLRLSVNVSALQFVQPGFADQLRGLLEGQPFEPSRLMLELTESMVVSNFEEVIERMREVGRLGVGLSMDDFGTGQSSLGNLRRLPIQVLKVDQSFVRQLPGDAGDAAIVRSILLMAGALGLEVIAEGVESAAQRDLLVGLGCLGFQGFLYGRAMPLDAFEVLASA